MPAPPARSSPVGRVITWAAACAVAGGP